MSDHKHDSKKCLLAAAAKLFSKLGLEKTSTRDLAKESQANISLISYHFGGKEGLYKEVLKEFALEVQSNTNIVFNKFLSREMTKEFFIQEISAVIDNMISMQRKHPEICQILGREKLEGFPLSKEVHEEIFYPLIKKFFLLIESAQKKNIVRKEINPAAFFIFLSEGLFGFFEIMKCPTSLRADCQHILHDELLLRNQMIEIYLNGVLV